MCIPEGKGKAEKITIGDREDLYKILQSLRIIEGSSFVAAPSAGLYLSQMGAEVIRFDQIGGGPDFNRWPLSNNGASLYWEGLNKGKKSIAINLSDPQGRELVQSLICAPGDDRGLFLTNYPAAGFLAHEKLTASRPDLITIRVMGKADGSSALDYNVNSAIGLPMITGPESLGDDVVNHVLPAWDLLTGSYAAFALLAAERSRRDTGEGREVSVPLMDMATATMSNLGMIAEVIETGHDRPRFGNDVYGFLGRDFLTADNKRIIVMALTPRQWTGLVTSLNIAESVQKIEQETGVSFATDEGIRFIHREALNEVIGAAIAKRQSADLYSVFDENNVCWGPYNSLSQVAKDPSLVTENPVFSNIEHKSKLTYPTAGAPATLNDEVRQKPERAPYLGEHTDEILLEVLKLNSGEVGRLHDNKVVANKQTATTEC